MAYRTINLTSNPLVSRWLCFDVDVKQPRNRLVLKVDVRLYPATLAAGEALHIPDGRA